MRDYSYLIGQNINNWTVLDFDPEMTKETGRTCMKCQCKCGTIKGVRAKDLANGKSQSCGCLRRERTSQARFKDLTGMRFGRWLVLGIDWENTTPGEYYYICQCDCGTIKSVSARNLRSGMSTSCGCYRIEVMSKSNKIYTNEKENYGVCFFNDDNSDKYFIFDLEDIDIVKEYCWCMNSNGYACANIRDENNINHQLYFHRIIMERKYGNIDDFQVDHANHNTLDDRKDINLRLCTRAQNQLNRTSKISNIGERNVSYSVERNNYAVNIANEPTKYFGSKEDAILYRNNYFDNNPNEFRYDPNSDIRNFNNINDDGSISPLFVVSNYRFIIAPFTIIDEDKFNK